MNLKKSARKRFYKLRSLLPIFKKNIVPHTPRLHLACGNNFLPGWLNTDFYPEGGAVFMDFTRTFPFATASFDAAFCEHSIEHIAKSDAKFMCEEVHRVLKPGGRFRVVTPSIEKFAKLALSDGSDTAKQYLAWFRKWSNDSTATLSDALNAWFFKHGHRHLFTHGELSDLLQQAGFKNIKILEPEEYGDPVFSGADGHGKVVGSHINSAEAMAIEAEKA
jgi:predicted SAM-dependent methyltransferase